MELSVNIDYLSNRGFNREKFLIELLLSITIYFILHLSQLQIIFSTVIRFSYLSIFGLGIFNDGILIGLLTIFFKWGSISPSFIAPVQVTPCLILSLRHSFFLKLIGILKTTNNCSTINLSIINKKTRNSLGRWLNNYKKDPSRL